MNNLKGTIQGIIFAIALIGFNFKCAIYGILGQSVNK